MKSTKQGRKSIETKSQQLKRRLRDGECTTCGVKLGTAESKKVTTAGTILPFEGVCAHHRTDIR